MKKIKSALISVFHKEGLDHLIPTLKEQGVVIYSTGGTQRYIENLGAEVVTVETLTGYPSILDGRVKTLHPKVFGGILARSEAGHLQELKEYDIPEIDLVVVDLYPFEKTVAETSDESRIIEKIDIGGISLIRAAAKNFNDVVVISDQSQYLALNAILKQNDGCTTLEERRFFARKSFSVSAHYDTAIHNYFSTDHEDWTFHKSMQPSTVLRYGENPHQKGVFFGNLEDAFEQLHGKALSYNNLVDIDSAVQFMQEFREGKPTFAVLKHTNTCGAATREILSDAWDAALAGDPISAFGGILICNKEVDLASAEKIHSLFFEVLIAPSFTPEAFAHLSLKRKKRILLQWKDLPVPKMMYKRLLNGVIQQEADLKTETADDFRTVTKESPSAHQMKDLVFANICAKHLKSNTIALVKDEQLIGMGCGQTSRVDALKQAIIKARAFGFDLQGAVMASDAFFPFPDCVEIAHEAGIVSVVQPGGSIKDQESIDYCDSVNMSMVCTGTRHFKH